MGTKTTKPKINIEEIEAALLKDGEAPFEILPDGEIVRTKSYKEQWREQMEQDGFKFLVIKAEDLLSALSEDDLRRLDRMLAKFNKWRRDVRGKPVNSYYVINRDEPYADEVRDVLRKHIPESEWGYLLIEE